MKWFAQIVVENFITILRPRLSSTPLSPLGRRHCPCLNECAISMAALKSMLHFANCRRHVSFFPSISISEWVRCRRAGTINQFKLNWDGLHMRRDCWITPWAVRVSVTCACACLSGMQSAFLICKIEKHLSIQSHQFACLSTSFSLFLSLRVCVCVCLVVSLRPAHTHTHSFLVVLAACTKLH